MNSSDFVLGMDHNDALAVNSLAIAKSYDKESFLRFYSNFLSLPSRPDWNGVVSIEEGILWAKNNPMAITHSSPCNILYIDASKLNFGTLSVKKIKKYDGDVNLFNIPNAVGALFNKNIRNTVYALGKVGISIEDEKSGLIRINNGEGTDYDWNRGGSFIRDFLICIERIRTGLGDDHGFKVYYYGTGKINK